MPEVLSPFVYWAQTESNVTLKVELKDVKNPDVTLLEKNLQFTAEGHGAKGPHNYGFSLNFHSAVDPEGSQFKVSERQVDFILKKKDSGWWPRLTGTPQKPVWLKIDFDRWKSEDDLDDEEPRDVMGDYPGLYDRLEKEELGYRKDMRKVYLVFYNLAQFIGFMYILTVIAVRYSRDGPDSMEGTYQAVGGAMKFCQLMQILEIMHPLFGYTKGGVLAPFMQVGGRNFVLFFMIEAEPRMADKPVVFYLFIVWSLIEIIRYPYYIAQLYKKNIGLLTWLRYTIWIPLYPLGGLCEGVIILRNIPYFEETQRFTVTLPNSWNFAFHFPSLLRIYLLILFIPGLYVMMSHMYRARIQKLGPKKWRSKFD
ncbi:very-long-chain (3R)-3-hydroxyacyl-CoA dehydratase isoform X2 [Anabrus simplex]|uniref:very-long-chain (3R)-3-hydroxyacyl-CoA dehydratase isoform X2 n=1 Tax=Anabrus simplex TaxID=316456 RepID=UPI0035A3C645